MENKTLKILMTTDTLGGVWTHTLELCRELQHYGVQVHLAAMGALPTETQQEEIACLQNVIFYKSDYKLEWMEDPWDDMRKARKWITAIYHTVHPDIVHFNNYTHIDNSLNCPVITTYHSCVYSWWLDVKGTLPPHSWAPYRQWVKASLQASSVIVSPTRHLLEQVTKIHNIKTRTEVIYNGRSISGSTKKQKEQFILCSGRMWDEAKNLQLLSRLARHLSWPVYVAGDSRHPGTDRSASPDGIIYLGKLTPRKLSGWMQRASIYLSPATYEPFGLAILEAAKHGCALALNNIGTLREVWGHSAAYFNAGNLQDTERTINTLIRDPAYRKRIAMAARNQAKKYHSGKMGREYNHLYQQLLSRRKTRSVTF